MPEELTPEYLSKRIFGRKHRIGIWKALLDATVEPPHTFRQIDLMLSLQQERKLQPSSTQAELAVIKELGMIELSSDPTNRDAYYRLTESPIWAIANAAVLASGEFSPPLTSE